MDALQDIVVKLLVTFGWDRERSVLYAPGRKRRIVVADDCVRVEDWDDSVLCWTLTKRSPYNKIQVVVGRGISFNRLIVEGKFNE